MFKHEKKWLDEMISENETIVIKRGVESTDF
jgi:hypothetical protein